MTDEYPCDECEKTYKTRAGLWKHKKNKHTAEIEPEPEPESDPILESPAEDESITSSLDDESAAPNVDESETEQETESAGGTQPEWMDFQFSSEEGTTDQIPTQFKLAVSGAGKKGKLTKTEMQALLKRNTALLKMGLTTTDHLLTKYAQAVCLDPEM